VLGVAEDYNAFIFHNRNQTSDSRGAQAFGGNPTLNNYAAASARGNSTTNLVVGGNLPLNNGSINSNGNINNNAPADNVYVGGNDYGNNGPQSHMVYYEGTFSGPTWVPSTHVSSITEPVDFGAAETQPSQTSSSLSNWLTTGSLNDCCGTLTFTGANEGHKVFSIAAGTLDSSGGVNMDIPSDGFAIVNVTGSSTVSLPNVGFNFNSSNVLWNLSGVSTLNMTSFNGSILAPTANVDFAYNVLNGTLVANSLSSGGELHNVPSNHTQIVPSFSPGSTVPLPNSAQAGLVLLGILGVGGWRHRRRNAHI
jgi:choice-of-anchor A domain-containing protein/MYXO-CTERM domain-containing protein